MSSTDLQTRHSYDFFQNPMSISYLTDNFNKLNSYLWIDGEFILYE